MTYLGESIGFWIQTSAICLTAIIAFISVYVALQSAKKRATIDLVLNQRSDPLLIDAKKTVKDLHDNNSGMAKYACKESIGGVESCAILVLLNNYEFIAAGIREGAFNEEIYKRMVYGTTMRDWHKLKAYIAELRDQRQHPTLFQEFMWLGEKWKNNPLEVETENKKKRFIFF